MTLPYDLLKDIVVCWIPISCSYVFLQTSIFTNPVEALVLSVSRVNPSPIILTTV